MSVMSMINDEWFSSDDRFELLMKELESIKEMSDRNGGCFCKGTPCNGCPFENWCNDSNNDNAYPSGDLLDDGLINDEDDGWNYIIKALPKEYDHYKKRNRSIDSPPSDIACAPEPKKVFNINILGSDWTVHLKTPAEDPKLENCDGYCDPTVNQIVVLCKFEDDVFNMKDLHGNYMDKVIKHEIVHAFFYESGLGAESPYYQDEMLVDWIALQFDKINKAITKVRDERE